SISSRSVVNVGDTRPRSILLTAACVVPARSARRRWLRPRRWRVERTSAEGSMTSLKISKLRVGLIEAGVGGSGKVEHQQQRVVDRAYLLQAQMGHLLAERASIDCSDHLAEDLGGSVQ